MTASRRSIAIIAAHPDDEVLSLGALLLKARDDAFRIHIMWITKGLGSLSPNANLRWSEAVEVAGRLDATYESLGLKEGAFADSDLIPLVDERLHELLPNVVAWPFGKNENQHQDHRQLHAALMNIQNRWAYHDAVWIAGQPPVDDDPGFAPSFYLEFGAHRLLELQQLMELYASEKGKHFADPDYLKTKRRYAAYSARLDCAAYRYAEPYMSIKGLPPASLFRMPVLHLVNEVSELIRGCSQSQEVAIMAAIAELDKSPSRSALRWSKVDAGLYRTAITHDETKFSIIFVRHEREDREDVVVVNVLLGKVSDDAIKESLRHYENWEKEAE